MSGCGVLAPFILAMLLSGLAAAPVHRTIATSIYAVSGETRGLEVPTELIVGAGVGMSSVQLVVNVHTDSSGNIEVQTN